MGLYFVDGEKRLGRSELNFLDSDNRGDKDIVRAAWEPIVSLPRDARTLIKHLDHFVKTICQ